ncbi:MAG: response regulator, partial [Bacteroidales bacterium]|nr:response regulator [Bacteroidales bacterium]
TNGLEAIEWLDEQFFDLVLLDIMMPALDGYETCRIIRERKDLDDMPVIFITAKMDKESIVKGFNAGAQDYISKPFDMQELLARVRTHLELRISKLKLNEVNTWLEDRVKERTAQLESANIQLSNLDQAKTEFLNLIGHELRTPLNGIVGPMELIKGDNSEGELGKMLGIMSESVDRLEKFAFEALTFTNLRTGKQSIQTEEFNVCDMFREVHKRTKTVLDNNNTGLLIDIPDDLIASGDRELLITCMEKLVENSLIYIQGKGDITISVEKKAAYLSILMSDTRITLSDTFLDGMDKLFEPGGDYADSNLGIAMALVNLILKAHKGSLVMENIKDRGATLRIDIAQ